MSATQYMPPIPPASTYSYQQPAYYPQQNYSPQQSYYLPPQYQQPPPQQSFYPQPQYPQQFQQPPPYPTNGRTPPPPQSWPSHAEEYMGPGIKYNYYRDEDTPDYNNPPEPQYGVPESQRRSQRHRRSESRDGSDPRFVFPNSSGQQQQGPNGDGERGVGAAVLGGGAGALLGHKMHHGAVGTIGGLALGAIAANAFEHHQKKKREERRESRAFDSGYEGGEGGFRRNSRSRDVEDDDGYDDEQDDGDAYEPGYRHHHHHDYDRDYDERYYRQEDYYREDYDDRRDDY